MITGRWGKPSEVLLVLTAEPDGTVRGVANPGREDAPIRRGHFDAGSGKVHLGGEYLAPDGAPTSFQIDGRLEGRRLRLSYQFGETRGEVEVVRVEEYRPPPLTIFDRVKPRVAALKRWI